MNLWPSARLTGRAVLLAFLMVVLAPAALQGQAQKTPVVPATPKKFTKRGVGSGVSSGGISLERTERKVEKQVITLFFSQITTLK